MHRSTGCAARVRLLAGRLDHAVLHLDGAAHGVDDAAELNEASVARALHYERKLAGPGFIFRIISPDRNRVGGTSANLCRVPE